MNRIVTFGEIMARLATPGFLRFRQALPGILEVTFAGAEANVAASLAMLGAEVSFVSALPKHAIADACVDRLCGLGIDTRFIVRTDAGRLGLYFLEAGANQRPSQVIYDRDGAAVALTEAERYPWPAIFADARWLHVSGITPALSQVAAEEKRRPVEKAFALFRGLLQFLQQFAHGLHLLHFDRSELFDLLGILAVVRQVVMAERHPRDRRHVARPQEHHGDQPG
jgi:2-dehydro-3-deoxygluconokinase